MGSGSAESTIQRIGVVGAGAMGSSLASMLGQVVMTIMVCRSSHRASHIVRDGVKTTGLIEATARPIVVQSIADLMRMGGVSVVFIATKVEPHIETQVWKKGILNAATNPVCALVNSRVGQVLDSPARMIVDRLLREGLLVAEARGLKLGDDFAADAYRFLDSARDHTPSMVEDIRQGSESEVGQLNRQIVEHARKLAVSVATHESIDALIETFGFKAYARAGNETRESLDAST